MTLLSTFTTLKLTDLNVFDNLQNFQQINTLYRLHSHTQRISDVTKTMNMTHSNKVFINNKVLPFSVNIFSITALKNQLRLSSLIIILC